MAWLQKYKSLLLVNFAILAFILLISIIWELAPLRIEGFNTSRFLHYSAHMIAIPLLTIYLPLRLIKKHFSGSKKAYLFGLLFSLFAGIASATYTHFISTPGSFLLKIEGGEISKSDPDYDPTNETNNYLTLFITNSTAGYDKPPRKGYFYVEAFLHSLLYCIYMLSYLQVFGILNKRKLKIKLKQQQLDTLQYQLNPHFLFNSLNSIRGMLYEDVDEAKRLLQEFRLLFKHHFDNKKHCVSLAQEVLMCRHYLKLETVRFEERLKVNWFISDDLNSFLVPSMGIFTLIENAIKHGIAQMPNGGKIDISVTKERKKLDIVVTNTINVNARQADGTRTGLSNLESRLALLYQGNFSLNTERTPQLFEEELAVPVKKGYKDE